MRLTIFFVTVSLFLVEIFYLSNREKLVVVTGSSGCDKAPALACSHLCDTLHLFPPTCALFSEKQKREGFRKNSQSTISISGILQNLSGTGIKLKAELDPAATFLILSDTDTMLLHDLNIHQYEDPAQVVSVGKFASPASILSLSCVSARLRSVKKITERAEVSTDSEDRTDNIEAGVKRMEKMVVRLYMIQHESLVECSISLASLGNISAPMIQTSPVVAASAPPQSPPPSSSPRSHLPVLPDLATAASKMSEISLLSPEQFSSAAPAMPPVSVKTEPADRFSGNSSPSREVAGILDDCVQFEANEEENEDEEEESEEVTTFQGVKSSPKPHNTTLTSIKFPTPPAPPAVVLAPGHEMGDKLESMLDSRLDMMEKRMEARARRDNQAVRQRIDELFVTLSASVNTKIEETVGTEIKRSLPVLVKKSLDGIHKDMNQKISGLENKVVKELTSGQSKDMISRAVVKNVSELVDASFKKAFANQMSGMENAFRVVLSQINDQFLAGTKEYEASLRRKMETENVEVKQMVTPIVSTVQAVNNEMKQLRDVVEKLKNDQNNLNKTVADKKSLSAEEVRRIVAKEVNDALVANRYKASSHTPVPDVKTISNQTIIKNHISAGNFNDAFQTALSSSDLAMVMFTCENVNITQVFNQSTCPLSQSVLLSLIQQLSVDISDRTQVKHAYLHEALANLDPQNHTTKMHIRPVLKMLEASLQKYMQESPNSKMTRSIKILSMAAQSHLQTS